MHSQSARYRPFGAFRCALALMVLLQHGLLLLHQGARDVLYRLELGALAVAVFFALSGFIVAEALAWFYAGRPGAFLVNRLLRVAPPYLAALALAVAADSLLYSAGRLVPLDAPLAGAPWQPRVVLAAVLEVVPGLPAHRISGQDFSFIPFAWTLRVEFGFYVAAAGAAWLMAYRAGAVWRQRVAGVAFAAAYTAFGVFLVRHRLYGAAGGGLQLLNVPFFAFGVCAYAARANAARGTAAHLAWAACLVPVAFVLCGERGHPVLAFQLPLLGVLFAALLALSRAPSPRGAWLAWDKRLGALSYPLYIGHGVVLSVLASTSAARGALPYGLAIVLSFCLAAALNAVVERPLAVIRARIRGADI